MLIHNDREKCGLLSEIIFLPDFITAWCVSFTKVYFFTNGVARTNRQNWVPYFPCENDLYRAMLPDCLETLSSTLCQISALKEAIG